MESVEARPAVVNFTRFQLETHVRDALRTAWILTGGKPVSAADLLRGALVVARTSPSEAFRKLSEVLRLPPGLSPPPVEGSELAPPDLAAMQLTPPAAAAFSVAEGFLGDGASVWGRDYVTLALLARDDPSLSILASNAGRDLAELRREWFGFVSDTDKRRPREAWIQWWRGAGIAPPRDGEAPAAPAGPAYLFTWNPARYPFPELDAHAAAAKAGRPAVFPWSTGNRGDVSPGGRVFLVRQGKEPRGLVGVGEVTGAVVEAPHWDPKERERGRTSRLVEVRWTALSRAPFLDRQRLVDVTGEESPWSSVAGGILLDGEVVRRLEEAWPHAWARHVHGLPEELPELEPRRWIARFDADRGGKGDALKIDRYVKAFARVIASRSLAPPMSIGLFGDWGSGKTFFMDRLHAEIERLGREPDLDPPLYWRHVCQMRFNAWHYTETNLWASLVSTIFKELRAFLEGRQGDSDQFNRLLNELELVRELRKEAEKRLADATAALEQARARAAKADAELAALAPLPALTDVELRAVLGKSVREVVRADPQEIAALLRQAAAWSGRKELDAAARRLVEGEATVEGARSLLADAVALGSTAGFWWRILAGARLYRTRAFWVSVGALVAVPALFWLAHRLELLDAGWAHLWTLVGEAIALVGAAVASARSALGKASSVFDRLGTLRARIESGVEEARGKDRVALEAGREKAARDEQQARAKLEQARREEQQAAEAERKAAEALRDSTSQARLGRFIRERTSTVDYEKHLGLIAMAHRDFQRLSELMQRARDSTEDAGLPRVDRIVLYIDDLDRCHPPSKVVRVLEAVHLLLFFPLFVVVVGVDSRWVSRALNRHYDGMLADEAIAASSDVGLERAPAESQDFLEKIFQVPFWLRRMEPAAVQRLIHDLILPAEIEASPAPPPPADAEGPPGLGAPPSSGGGEQLAGGAEPPQRAAAKRTTAEAELEDVAAGGPAAPSEGLRMSAAELAFMDQVAPLMPRTPRSVKRFVNIYRLYKAALPPRALARFLGTPGRPGNFRAVQVLLALVTGTPRFAHRVFHELRAAEVGSATRLSSLVQRLADGDEASQVTLDGLREFARAGNDLDLADLREVSPLVGRYSVHHMVSDAPGDAGLG